MTDWYSWLKVLHILSFVSWMAGLLYLPRLMVYHSSTLAHSQASELFITMERRLLVAIMRPAGLITVVSGGLLLWLGSHAILQAWLCLKILAVLGLVMSHIWFEHHARAFARHERNHAARYYRIINELPTVLLIFIVVLVIVKPWQ